MKPIIKWPGGKTQLLAEILPLIQNNLNPNSTFYEPFAGGLAVSLALQHKNTVVNDLNSELINMYQVIRDTPEELISELRHFQNNHSDEFYYQIRNLDRSDTFAETGKIIKAARTIYLNKTCFNGLYRVNSKGYFNSPIGRTSSGKTPDIIQEDLVREMSKFLKTVHFHNGDYRECLKNVKQGDIIFLDPPYDPDEDIKTDGFVGYQKEGWTRKNLVELKRLCDELVYRGCKVILTNNDTEYVKNLFAGYEIKSISVKRSINRDKDGRNGREVIIWSK